MANEKAYISTKPYSITLVPQTRNDGNKKAKSMGKTFSAYVNELIEKDVNR